MPKSKKNKHKANRKRTQNLYTGPIPVQYAKCLKEFIRTKTNSMSDYNYLVDEKYKTNKITTYINMERPNKPLYEIYKEDNGDDKCYHIAGQVLVLTWYKYHKIIYKMSQSILDYIDNAFCIPDNYDDLLNNLPQKVIYVDLSDTNLMSYDGDKIHGFFINISWIPYNDYISESGSERFRVNLEENKERSLEFVGILSDASGQLPTTSVFAPIDEIMRYDHNKPSDYVSTQHNVWLTELVLKIALYLCITKPNAVNKEIKPSKNGTHQSANVTIVDLSDQYKDGPVFDPHKTEKTVYKKDGESDNSDNHMPPHIRSGHWQTYWTGKGRTVPVQKFVKECFVNCDDASKLPTVGRAIKRTDNKKNDEN